MVRLRTGSVVTQGDAVGISPPFAADQSRRPRAGGYGRQRRFDGPLLSQAA